MTNPITGPVTTWPIATSFVYKKITSMKQKRPYNKRLPFVMDTASGTPSGVCYFWGYSPIDDSPAKGLSLSKAYERFNSALKSDEAQLAVSLAEYHQARDMIVKRVVQLTSFANAVRKLQFGKASTILGTSKIPRALKDWRTTSRDFGSNVLEYHFGWAPLVQDIGNAVKTLQ